MICYATLILPYLSAGFPVLAAAHVVGSGGVILMTWFFLFAVHTVMARIDQVAMRPAIATTVRWFGAWFLGGFQFVQALVENFEHLFETGLGDTGGSTVIGGFGCGCRDSRHVSSRVFDCIDHVLGCLFNFKALKTCGFFDL